MEEVLPLADMEEENLVACESAASETPDLTNSEHSLEQGLTENKPFKKELYENEPKKKIAAASLQTGSYFTVCRLCTSESYFLHRMLLYCSAECRVNL